MDNTPEFKEEYGIPQEMWNTLTVEEKKAYANVGAFENQSGLSEENVGEVPNA